MQIKAVPAPVLSAAVGLLQPFAPAITPAALIEALKAYGNAENARPASEKPLTRREAAAALGVSLNSINRYMKCGTLRFKKIGAKLVRIDPASVRALTTYNRPEVMQ